MMQRLPSDKYNIAWFKLAEFVSRGEKERSLALYKLLSHSLHDQALVCQLEGDIFLAFGDPKALESYQKAASLYASSGRPHQAALVYEHLLTVQPAYEPYLKQLVEIFMQIECHDKVLMYASLLIRKMIASASFDTIDFTMTRVGQFLSSRERGRLCQELVICYVALPIEKQCWLPELFNVYFEEAVLAAFEEKVPGGAFLARLGAVSPLYFDKASTFFDR